MHVSMFLCFYSRKQVSRGFDKAGRVDVVGCVAIVTTRVTLTVSHVTGYVPSPILKNYEDFSDNTLVLYTVENMEHTMKTFCMSLPCM